MCVFAPGWLFGRFGELIKNLEEWLEENVDEEEAEELLEGDAHG